MKNIREFWVTNTNGAILFQKSQSEESETDQYFGCFLSAIHTFILEMGSEQILVYETKSFIYYLDYDDTYDMKLIFVIKTIKGAESRSQFQKKLSRFKSVFLEKNSENLKNWDGQVDIFGNSEEIFEIFNPEPLKI